MKANAVESRIQTTINFFVLLNGSNQTRHKKISTMRSPLGVSLYCVVLAYSLIGIETGIVDLEVILIFFLAFLYVLISE